MLGRKAAHQVKMSARRGSPGAAATASISQKAMAISTIWRFRDRQAADRRIRQSIPNGPGKLCPAGLRRSTERRPPTPTKLAPAPAFEAAMHDAGVLDDRQVRAERQFLENAANAGLSCSVDALASSAAVTVIECRPHRKVSPPLMTLTMVDLPAPLWPTRPTHSPAPDLQRDAVERLHCAEIHSCIGNC